MCQNKTCCCISHYTDVVKIKYLCKICQCEPLKKNQKLSLFLTRGKVRGGKNMKGTLTLSLSFLSFLSCTVERQFTAAYSITERKTKTKLTHRQMSTALMQETRGMEALTPVMMVDMVSTVVMPEGNRTKFSHSCVAIQSPTD